MRKTNVRKHVRRIKGKPVMVKQHMRRAKKKKHRAYLDFSEADEKRLKKIVEKNPRLNMKVKKLTTDVVLEPRGHGLAEMTTYKRPKDYYKFMKEDKDNQRILEKAMKTKEDNLIEHFQEERRILARRSPHTIKLTPKLMGMKDEVIENALNHELHHLAQRNILTSPKFIEYAEENPGVIFNTDWYDPHEISAYSKYSLDKAQKKRWKEGRKEVGKDILKDEVISERYQNYIKDLREAAKKRRPLRDKQTIWREDED